MRRNRAITLPRTNKPSSLDGDAQQQQQQQDDDDDVAPRPKRHTRRRKRLSSSIRRKKKMIIISLCTTIVVLLITSIGVIFNIAGSGITAQQHSRQQMLRGGVGSDGSSCSINFKITTQTKPSYNVAVFYYPWYRTKEYDGKYRHWNHKLLPHWTDEVNRRYGITDNGPIHHTEQNLYDIGATYYPQLGPYSSWNTSVIEIHMDQIRTAGIGVIVISWYPPNTVDDGQPKDEQLNFDKMIPLYLQYAQYFDLKVALHVEPYSDRTATNTIKYITDACKTHGKHPSYYKIDGRPVFYIYDSYRIDVNDWANAIGKGQQESNSNNNKKENNPFLYMLWVERSHSIYLEKGKFDGAYTYFASDGMVWGSNTNNWKLMADMCHRLQKRFSPSVGPGYNDLAVRPWNSAATKSRILLSSSLSQSQPFSKKNYQHHNHRSNSNIQRRINTRQIIDNDEGKESHYKYYYERMLHKAIECTTSISTTTQSNQHTVDTNNDNNNDNNNFGFEISITSWNEWHEGTQIEPANCNKIQTAGIRRDKQYLNTKDMYYPSYDGVGSGEQQQQQQQQQQQANMYIEMTRNILQNWTYY